MLNKTALCGMALLCLVLNATYGQATDSVAGTLVRFPAKLFGRIQSKTANLNQRLSRQTERYLQRMAKQEERLQKKLYSKCSNSSDSTATKSLFANSAERYAVLERRLKTDTGGGRSTAWEGPYLPYVDSLKTSLGFLQQHPQMAGSSGEIQMKLQGSVSQFQQLQAKMQDAEAAKHFLQQRQAQMQQFLQHFSGLHSGVTNAFTGYKKQAYYYSRQLQSYKDELNDPDKLLKAGLQALNRLPAFTSFMKKYSMLGILHNVPSDPGAAPAGQGMPGRDQVMSAIQGTAGGNSPVVASAMQQNVQSAQGEVDQLREKLSASGSGGGGDLTVPDFKPNDQKTRPFLRRLQLGTNLQSTHSSRFYPMTTDIGLSLGYKIDSKNVIGVGVSYKVGWGSDTRHVQVTNEGVGLRSFLDFQVKKTWYASGGFEYNYQKPFTLQGIPVNLNNWQKSALVGVSKIVAMKSGVLKNTRIQLLWDLLSYQQIPRATPIKFRIGYSF